MHYSQRLQLILRPLWPAANSRSQLNFSQRIQRYSTHMKQFSLWGRGTRSLNPLQTSIRSDTLLGRLLATDKFDTFPNTRHVSVISVEQLPSSLRAVAIMSVWQSHLATRMLRIR